MLSFFQPNRSVSVRRYGLLGFILLAAFIMRLILAPMWIGYDTDVGTFLAWSDRAYTVGLPALYTDAQHYFLDYPPGYMYVLYAIGFLHHAFGIPWESPISLLILKMPAMLADVGLAYAVYRLTWQVRGGQHAEPLALAGLMALNPAMWVNSAMWGQVDSFFMLFILMTLFQQQRGKLPQASVWLALAILLKPQALLFGPFLLIDVLRRRDWMLFC
ncbi:glycosyltransferase 87 family protein [Paenibacillus hexagrammi]|uniref:Glycosyltransferase 87 family protein n=1 Tax=Paenibacillus hexagrammi TaxID=2908839 RepID=A0ABY3SKC8_9BACL|nr:glycosyltransferase 87 family protein [Paenibacillus sp. YPD9-1]UJF34507.1 glycosyltransferase 87 family protein [Paenibacillus sp. YPD9-1]